MRTSMRRHKRHKLKAEINVVPYIDVMLVLLIIFMVTAPLLHLGVDIKLPQAAAKAMNDKHKQPVLVSLDRDGNLYLTLGAAKREQVDAKTLVAKVGAFVRNNPHVTVMFGGDERVDYGRDDAGHGAAAAGWGAQRRPDDAAAGCAGCPPWTPLIARPRHGASMFAALLHLGCWCSCCWRRSRATPGRRPSTAWACPRRGTR